MSVLYQNVNLGSYSATIPSSQYGQQYTFEFSTNSNRIYRSDWNQYPDVFEFGYALMDGIASGFALMMMEDQYGTQSDNPIAYVNMRDVVLPTEIGDTVEGELQPADWHAVTIPTGEPR